MTPLLDYAVTSYFLAQIRYAVACDIRWSPLSVGAKQHCYPVDAGGKADGIKVDRALTPTQCRV
jgi:hypothetical protein